VPEKENFNYTFKNDEVVKYSIKYNGSSENGVGRVVGVATIPMPILNTGYIIESIDGKFPNADYPWKCIVVYEAYLEKFEVA